MAVRTRAPSTGTVAAAGADNDLTDPKIVIFDPPVRPCLIRLTEALTVVTTPVLIKVNTEVNGTVSDDFSTGTLAHFALSAITSTVDASVGGMVSVHSIAIATQNAGDDIDHVAVAGWAE